ncbi:uncharacterized protein YBL010C [Kluyveromyces marxianus]|nr:uncharacterized protein YBL010C [Kluyveromyces marxianus]
MSGRSGEESANCNGNGSDSDSDFGDFGEATVKVEELEVPEESPVTTEPNASGASGGASAGASTSGPVVQENSATAVEAIFDCTRKVLAAKKRGIEIRDKKVLFQDLLKNEKTKKIYDSLFPDGQPLPPSQWRKEPLQRLIRQTLGMEEPHDEEEEEEYVIQDLLYLKLEEDEHNTLESLGYERLNEDKEKVPSVDISELLAMQEFSSVPLEKLTVVHDQLIDAIEKVQNEINTLKAEERELLKDKETYEELITNLVGHTQRIRREEIAEYKKKHKSLFKRK